MSDVIAAIATPLGEGAIGMLRLSGADCVKVASSFVRWHHRGPAPRTATLATAYEDGRLLDRVIVTYFPGPRSYTGEDLIEIASHGAPFILSRLLEQACRKGARLAEPGEFSRRAFLNGRMDLAQAEAVCSLIQSKTRSAHQAAISQMEGGLSRKVRSLQKGLLDLLASVEASLDHPDEDIPELSQSETRKSISRIRGEVDALIRSYRIGKLAIEGARVAIVGAPNVGKSSLLNSLLGKDRAIVTDTPGTTRDTLEEPADLDGLKTLLIDTAGLRDDARDPVEAMGIERARLAIKSADLILLALDRSRVLSADEHALLKELWTRTPPSPFQGEGSQKSPVIIVLNKSDLPPQTTAKDIPYPWPSVEISALTGFGIDRLLRAITLNLGTGMRDEESSVLLISLRHHQALEEAARALDRAKLNLPEGELAALALREAMKSIGSIIGETTSEDLLQTIFSKFCIGK